jgi:hypothetical protein
MPCLCLQTEAQLPFGGVLVDMLVQGWAEATRYNTSVGVTDIYNNL